MLPAQARESRTANECCRCFFPCASLQWGAERLKLHEETVAKERGALQLD
jgi:hypothetical protein